MVGELGYLTSDPPSPLGADGEFHRGEVTAGRDCPQQPPIDKDLFCFKYVCIIFDLNQDKKYMNRFSARN